ncbi:MAG TPA: hypothetical protein VFI47_12355 [Acidimicrobiales bacterium]|nr:hypothetical protein [Acidimicrobiales bacterium]
MRSTRLLIERMSVDDDDVGVGYADVFVVVRDGEEGPGPNDWEVTLQSASTHPLAPGEHDLRIESADGALLTGRALLRFSDGSRHLFRGDSRLVGYVERD